MKRILINSQIVIRCSSFELSKLNDYHIVIIGAYSHRRDHLLPVINVVGNTAPARQEDPTDIAPLKRCDPFALVGQLSLSIFMTGNK